MRLTSSTGARVYPDSRRQEILSAQVRLLYANASLGVVITIFAATMLGFLQWGTVPNFVVAGWWLYTTLVALSRLTLAQGYRRASRGSADIITDSKWEVAFVVGAGLAGAGWGGAGILLYPEAHLANQVFLVFVLRNDAGRGICAGAQTRGVRGISDSVGFHPCGSPYCPG